MKGDKGNDIPVHQGEHLQSADEEEVHASNSSNHAAEHNALPYAVTGYGSAGYQERIHDELHRRESELAKLDREIDGLMHWLERAKPKRRPFIGSAGLLSSQGNFVKELRDRLIRKRIARATMLIEVTRARERMESEE